MKTENSEKQDTREKPRSLLFELLAVQLQREYSKQLTAKQKRLSNG